MTLDRVSIRDRVDVVSHPTVVRLADLEKENTAWLSESFVVTPEINRHLQALAQVFGRNQGTGIFLIGHYGSGKSHFLSYLIQILQHGEWIPDPPAVSFVSLVNFSSENRLEKLVTERLGIEAGSGDRREAWDRWYCGQGSGGHILVLDEVSEFLRSKSDVRLFTEDIRFLQFIGEWAQDKRFWIIAAMQEAIEHTGELEYSLYRKIKDRYPIRLILTPAHVQTLIADGILKKKQAYQADVQHLLARLRCSFPAARFDDRLFCRIYPLHPATLELLEEIRDRFSQARGIVDFTVSRMRGDSARGIPAFLDQPWGALLAPDLIIDHFADLFELQPEFMPLAQQVMPWYRKHMETLFSTDSLRHLAERILKLLILVHLSPRRESLSVNDAAEWLMFSAIVSDPERNIRVVDKVLSRLAGQGRYISLKEDGYRLVPEGDDSAHLDKLVPRETEALREQTSMVIDILVSLLPGSIFNPFVLPRNQWQHRRLMWHFHEREYAVWFGEKAPAERSESGFCIKVPGSEDTEVSGMVCIEPGELSVSEDLIEIAALARIADQPIAAQHRKSILQRVESRLPAVVSAFRNCWAEAVMVSADGRRENVPRMDASAPVAPWLDAVAVRMLGRRYPGFERFAPAHGPLPREAWLRYMRCALNDDPGRGDADDYVKLIREAYLVPMGLLRRSGRDYIPARNAENLELVKALMPLLEHTPAPRVVHKHFAEPVYGLVPDQVNLLLVFLLLQGEIDIVKERHSYRDYFETLINPLQYDQIVPAQALDSEQVKALRSLCDAFAVRVPGQWSVLAQKRVLQRLAEIAQKTVAKMTSLDAALSSENPEIGVRRRLDCHLECWNILTGGSDLKDFEVFYSRVESINEFIDEAREFERLGERLPRLMEELRRRQHLFDHLLQQQCAGPTILEAIRDLGNAPGLEDLSALENWLYRGRVIYDCYKEEYRNSHEQWWRQQPGQEAWKWSPPAVAYSEHVGLARDLEVLENCRKECARQNCAGLVNLDYQPVCGCGFNGSNSPYASAIENFRNIQDRINAILESFFDQPAVKESLADWSKQSVATGVDLTAYLAGETRVPEVRDIALFDHCFSNKELAESVDFDVIREMIGGRMWEPARLKLVLEQWLAAFENRRIQFIEPVSSSRSDEPLSIWCLEQCLRYAIPVPGCLAQSDRVEFSAQIKAEWVSDEAIRQLDKLGLGSAIEDSILKGLLDGRFRLPEGEIRRDSLLYAAGQLLVPSNPDTPRSLAADTRVLYASHARMFRLAEGAQWRDRMEALAYSRLERRLPGLAATLEKYQASQWLLIDCWGLSLLEPISTVLESVLDAWDSGTIEFCEVSTPTTTDQCYRQLLDAGIVHSFHKCDVIDKLVHNRTLEHADLVKLAVTEIEIELSSLNSRLDKDEDLLVFSDHGFRMRANGIGYQHGQDSTLERVVPVWYRKKR